MRFVNVNRNKKNIVLYKLIFFIFLIAFLPPQIIDYKIPGSRELIYALRIVTSSLFLIIAKPKILNRKQIDLFWLLLFTFFFAISQSIIELIKGFGIISFRYVIFITIFTFSICSVAIKKTRLLIDLAVLVFGIYNIFQIIFLIVYFPQGMVMTSDGLAASVVYFLGGKNQAFICMLIFIISFSIKSYIEYKKISKKVYLIIVIFIVESIIIDSMTSLACLVLVAGSCLVTTTKLYKHIAFAVNPYILLMVSIAIFMIFCIMNTFSSFSESGVISELFHKFGRNMSFTGRTTIWLQALNMFIKSPIIGGNGQYVIVGENINQAHNAFLDVLSKFGLLGFIPYVLIIFSISSIIYKMKKEKILYTLCSISFFILLIHCMFEFMDIYYFIFLFALIICSKQIVTSQNVKTIISMGEQL